MNCPNCSTEMDHVALEGKYGADIEVDLCFACHVLWLDKREAVLLSPRGTMDLFRMLHEHRDDARHSLQASSRCPRCTGPLKLQHDIGKGGRFSYYSCPKRDGRLTPFSEFLKEKQFVRELTPAEKSRVRADVKNVQCSSCGAPVDVNKGFVCGHCSSPIAVLDADAVEKTLRELQQEDAARQGDPAEKEERARALAEMEKLRTNPYDDPTPAWAAPRGAGLGADLLSASLGVLFGRF